MLINNKVLSFAAKDSPSLAREAAVKSALDKLLNNDVSFGQVREERGRERREVGEEGGGRERRGGRRWGREVGAGRGGRWGWEVGEGEEGGRRNGRGQSGGGGDGVGRKGFTGR